MAARDTKISDEMRDTLAKLIDPDAWSPKLPEDGLGAYWHSRRAAARVRAFTALETVYPLIFNEAIERAAEVADNRVPGISREQEAAFARGDDRLGYQIHARHCEAITIAASIRSLTTPSKGE